MTAGELVETQRLCHLNANSRAKDPLAVIWCFCRSSAEQRSLSHFGWLAGKTMEIETMSAKILPAMLLSYLFDLTFASNNCRRISENAAGRRSKCWGAA